MAAPSVAALTPRAREILAAARELLESEGPEALSMRNLGERVGIRAASLYKHFDSKPALEAALSSQGFDEQAEMYEAALAASPDAVGAMGEAYRGFARRHPHLYRLMYDRSLDRSLIAAGSEERAVAPVLLAFGGDRDLARAAFAFAHGMAILELNHRFPADADVEAAWRRGLAALQKSIPGKTRRRSSNRR
jgi:AcrR family transcriptional regulator